ncbi:hypothetical protein STW0522ENT62_18600 [Enterobacter kobei]|nr:hypothetical protein STW0522ENT62_18600 [Enterobacter kobei]
MVRQKCSGIRRSYLGWQVKEDIASLLSSNKCKKAQEGWARLRLYT